MADLLGPLPDNLVRVGYISTTRGYISGLTICDANDYANLNPGTTFIFEDGDNNINYLNIEQVNTLTNEDVLRKDKCQDELTPCGPARVIVSGGSGIGAAGNPVIDPATGGIIAVDVISGGFAYQSAPTAELLDACKIGSGAVLKVVLGEAPAYEETFDDIEEYDLCEPGEFDNDDEEDLYDVDGNLVGKWDPRSYFPEDIDPNELEDPIQKEIAEYQKLVTQGIKDPWWSTRMIKPGSITSGTQTFPQAYNVILPPKLRTDLAANNSPVWTDFMDRYAISPVPPSNVKGSDYAGRLFLMNWEVEFPYDGEYNFKGSCDNAANLYIDQEPVLTFGKFFNAPAEAFKFVKKGVHRLRIDLLNKEIYEDIIFQGQTVPPVLLPRSTTTTNVSKEASLNLINFAGGGMGGIVPRGKFKFADGGIGLLEYNKRLQGKGFPEGFGGLTIPNSSTENSGGGGASHVSSRDVNFRGRNPYSFRGASGGGGGGLTLLGDRVNDFNNAVQYGNSDGTGGDGTSFGGGGGAGRPGRKAGNGANGAVRIEIDGKIYEYTKPGKYELIVPTDATVNPNTGLTHATIICIGGGGSGYSDARSDEEWAIEWRKSTGGLVSNPTQEQIDQLKKKYIATRTNWVGTGGGGGAWHLNDRARLKPGSILEIVVGAGGIAPTNSTGSQRGGDSFVKEKFVPNNEGAATRLSPTTIESSPIITSDIQTKNVFNTIDYISKADRPLYRINPIPSNDDFLSKYGVTPIKLDSPEAQDGSFAGTHLIRWEHVDFPVDGLYTVTIGVDDNVTLYIGNAATGGNKGNGSKLIPLERDGDEIVIRKQGFREPNKPNPISPTQVFVKAGKYRIRAELEQINGKPLAKGNPMALAIDIKVSYTEARVVSAKSWNENPMGVALAITAPAPPIPQEIRPPQKGRCPNNPIWSTRDAGASQQWYPVEIAKDKGGNAYLNRYTMSPVPPLDVPNSDGAGVIWSNSWKVNIPFDGRYRLDGARRQIARIKIDGKVVTGLTGPYTEAAQRWVEENFAGWKDPKTNTVNVGRKSTPVDLTKGEHEITVELVNIPQREVSYVDELIFSSIKSINEATIPLYHYTYKGWSNFLNKEGVTPCAPTIISIEPQPEGIGQFTLLPPVPQSGGFAAFSYANGDPSGKGDDVSLTTIFPFSDKFLAYNATIYASVKFSGNVSGNANQIRRFLTLLKQNGEQGSGYEGVTYAGLQSRGTTTFSGGPDIPGAIDFSNQLDGINVVLQGVNAGANLDSRFAGEPINIDQRGTWEISNNGKVVPKKGGKYGNTVSYYRDGQRQFTMTIVATQAAPIKGASGKPMFDVKTGYPSQEELSLRDRFLEEAKPYRNVRSEISSTKRALNNTNITDAKKQELNTQLNTLNQKLYQEEERLIKLGYAIRTRNQ